jgi:hypothetical protein
MEMLPAYSEALTGALPPPLGTIVGLLLPAVLAGGAGAARNFQKNYTITPEQLAAILAAEKAKKSIGRIDEKQLMELLQAALKAAKTAK